MENPAITRTMGLKAWTMIAALSVLWGAAFFFVAIAVREWPPVTVALCRTGGAALVLWPAIYLIGQRMALDATLWRAFFIMGLLNNVIPFLLNFWGQTHIASGVAAILNATSPLFTALVAHALTQDEKMGARHLAGVLLGLAGVAVMVGGEALLQSGASLWPVLGQIAIVAAAISYSFGGVFGRR
ncbi:MAG: DMT family transporter, partial [Alphaproteobacteria bacterium]|nr:DMT family transporter [Alphaproteobacteria bacterium]